MDFAREQLAKHGWTAGQGLGKDEEGIREAIKVKMKQDKKGVGHDPGEEFSFHWWDHVFNKAASKIQVNTTEDGVKIQNTGDTNVSKKKNCKTYDNKAMLYGQFIKGSTLSNGTETKETTVDVSSDDESGETNQCLMPDQEEAVFKMCGGRTAHKGARHGLKLNGKLLRIQEQEKILLDSYNLKISSKEDLSMAQDDIAGLESEKTSNDTHEEISAKLSKKNKKRKRKQRDVEQSDGLRQVEIDGEAKGLEVDVKEASVEEASENTVKSKKRKKSKKKKRNDDCVQVTGENKVEMDNGDIPDVDLSESKDTVTLYSYSLTECEVSQKRKKKKKKHKG